MQSAARVCAHTTSGARTPHGVSSVCDVSNVMCESAHESCQCKSAHESCQRNMYESAHESCQCKSAHESCQSNGSLRESDSHMIV